METLTVSKAIANYGNQLLGCKVSGDYQPMQITQIITELKDNRIHYSVKITSTNWVKEVFDADTITLISPPIVQSHADNFGPLVGKYEPMSKPVSREEFENLKAKEDNDFAFANLLANRIDYLYAVTAKLRAEYEAGK